MKKLLTILSCAAIAFSATLAFAYNPYADFNDSRKDLKKTVNSKAGKEYRKQAEKYEKEGWEAVGGGSLAKQLETAAEFREKRGQFVTAAGLGTAEDPDVALDAAILQAQNTLASNLKSKLASTRSRNRTTALGGARKGQSVGADTMRVEIQVARALELIEFPEQRIKYNSATHMYDAVVTAVVPTASVMEEQVKDMNNELRNGNAAANKKLNNLLDGIE